MERMRRCPINYDHLVGPKSPGILSQVQPLTIKTKKGGFSFFYF